MLRPGPDEIAALPAGVEELSFVLTTACNLRCDYCYQHARRPRAMDWEVLRAGLDRLVSAPGRRLGVSFTGGEPALQFGLVRDAVDYVSSRLAGDRTVSYHLVTNGLRLSPDDLAFLARHPFEMDVSVHGLGRSRTPPAAWFDALRRAHPAWFRRHITAALTLDAAGLPHLANTVDDLIALGLAAITVQPAMGQREWDAAQLAELDRQIARVFRASLDHCRATGAVPFVPFRREIGARGRRASRTWCCTAPLGHSLTVDVDGGVFPCAIFARSCQAFPDPKVRGLVSGLALGDVRDPALPARLRGLASACNRSGLFAPKRRQHSGGRPCGTCRHRAACRVCPAARVMARRVGEVDEVPACLCAFNKALSRCRRRFPPQPAASTPVLIRS
jgi:uncharacterized protein